MIKAHPTTYGGVNFRSRLEARWAAFFDLLGWKWQYEPIDLEGWVPDFSIQGASGPVYVEVKPIEWNRTHDGNNGQVRERGDLAKVRDYAKRDGAREVLVLGTMPSFMAHTGESDWAYLGCLVGSGIDTGFDAACLFCSPDTGFDFCAYYGSYRFRISGEYDGDHHLSSAYPDPEVVTRMWRQAGNATQWRGRVPA